MQRYVVAYDIPDSKRRNQVSDTLLAYGKKVNYSVFEIQIKSKAEVKALEDKLLTILKPKEDSLRFYTLCQNCAQKSWSLGEESAPFEQEGICFI